MQQNDFHTYGARPAKRAGFELRYSFLSMAHSIVAYPMIIGGSQKRI